ncbi:MAG: hypothetical protein ACLUKN_04335 [Bacilli bacterium]
MLLGLGEDSELVKELGRRLWENPITLESFIKNSKLVDFGGDALTPYTEARAELKYTLLRETAKSTPNSALVAFQIWDAVSGERYSPSSWSASENGTSVVLDLPKNGSAFVVIKRLAMGSRKIGELSRF